MSGVDEVLLESATSLLTPVLLISLFSSYSVRDGLGRKIWSSLLTTHTKRENLCHLLLSSDFQYYSFFSITSAVRRK